MADALCAAGGLIPGASFAGNCSSSSPDRGTSRIVSVELLRRGPRVIDLRAGKERASCVSSRAGGTEGDGEAVRGRDAALFSRRWAALVLPAVAGVGSIALPYGQARGGEVGIEIERGGDVENGADGGGRVELRTLNGCGLGVARYPDFLYNAEGGGGSGQAEQLADGRTHVRFDAERLYIPAVSFDTTTILGVPLPPGLTIKVVPRTLEGFVEQDTGKVELNFLADFYFTAGGLYSAPPLVVDTKLTTETTQGVFRGGKGQRLDSSGNVKLVGVARLAPVNDLFLRTFLTLPTECLAELSANLSFS